MIISAETEINLPSNRRFGFFFSAVFFLAFIYFYYKSAVIWSALLASLAIITIVFSLFAPDKLYPLNILWFKLGLLLGKVISPIVLGIIFFGLITPIGVIARMLGRDELRLKDTEEESYWIKRSPVGPEPETFKKQF